MFDSIIKRCQLSQRRRQRREAVFDSIIKRCQLSQKRRQGREVVFDSIIKRCQLSQKKDREKMPYLTLFGKYLHRVKRNNFSEGLLFDPIQQISNISQNGQG